MQQYIIGNWKMNDTKEKSQKLAYGFLKKIQEASRPLPHIILCPSYPYLIPVIEIFKDSPIEVGGQDGHPDNSGSFTGDVSISQLIDVGCKYVIIGHSERRQFHHETSQIIRKKIEAAIKAGLRPILCVGENSDERDSGKTLHVVAHQLVSDLPEEFTPQNLLIAYEPVWAIGTGRLPSLDQVEEVMGFIKHELSSHMAGGALVPTLYGGSVSAANAPGFLSLPHIDGLLIGGASLKLDEFWEIVNASVR